MELRKRHCFFSNCDQIRSFLQIGSHLLKKYLTENFIFCAVRHFFMLPSDILKRWIYSCKCMKLINSNGFLTKELTDGRKSCYESCCFFLKISVRMSLSKKRSVMQAVLIIMQPLSLKRKSWRFYYLIFYRELLQTFWITNVTEWQTPSTKQLLSNFEPLKIRKYKKL